MQVKWAHSEAGLGAPDNDDCAGWVETPSGLCAWVIDGATNIAGRDYLEAGRGDVAWYASVLSARLQASAARGMALADLHAAAAADAATLYRDLHARLPEPPPLYAQPMAALTIVRVSGSRGELYHLGDCPAFALGEDGGVRPLTHFVHSAAADESRARVEATQAAVGFSPKAVWADRLTSLRARRDEQLSASLLEVSTPVAGAAFGGASASFELGGVAALVLMSDGFERFAVSYELGDDADMVRRAVERGPAPLLAELRAVEHADPDCRRFPRLKPSDDATCLVIA